MAHIGIRIKKARLTAGMEPKQLAAKLKLTTESVLAWERGTSQPRPKRYPEIAKVCKARLEYIQLGKMPILLSDSDEDPGLDEEATEFATIMDSLTDDQIDIVFRVIREFQKAAQVP